MLRDAEAKDGIEMLSSGHVAGANIDAALLENTSSFEFRTAGDL